MKPPPLTISQRNAGDHIALLCQVEVINGPHKGKRGVVISMRETGFGHCFARVALKGLEGRVTVRASDLNRS